MQTPFVVDCIKEPEKQKPPKHQAANFSGDFASEFVRSAHRAIARSRHRASPSSVAGLGIIRAAPDAGAHCISKPRLLKRRLAIRDARGLHWQWSGGQVGFSPLRFCPRLAQFRVWNLTRKNGIRAENHQVKLGLMKRANKDAVADRFNKLNFHDDALLSLTLHPPRKRNNVTRIVLEFQDDATGSIKVLSFLCCANFRFVMDFDVLADRWYIGTAGSVAKTDPERMRKFVKRQLSHWRTAYMPPMPKDKPIKRKLASLRSYILFRVAFFGGTAEVLAKNYRLNR